MINIVRYYISSFLMVTSIVAWAQLSPGELSTPHASLEGLSNCTKCHTLGSKISNEKCLDCHTEIKVRVNQRKGYHSSAKVYKKSCILCHSEHHGRQYQIIHFDTKTFDHNTTGYTLEGKHASKQCRVCHTPANIVDQQLKKKKSTYLGLGRECISCHEDYHQKTLNEKCSDCHTYEGFKPASRFNHSKARFTLRGRHSEVECIKCHEISSLNGKSFQKFKGVKFSSCANCHKDVHNNQFGQKCSDCHVEESFKKVKNSGSFDHNLTNFKLEGRHTGVSCQSCHKGSLTAPVKHARCADCHQDFHEGDFVNKNASYDCDDCHDVNGFKQTSFTTERHNEGNFKLVGAHLKTECSACHYKSLKWRFSKIGRACNDCHEDIHKSYLDSKYYPEANCLNCHSPENWQDINFDHSTTKFLLQGKHKEKSCRSCHQTRATSASEIRIIETTKSSDNAISGDLIRFTGLPSQCMQCHEDNHEGQFTNENITNCSSCHVPEGWLVSTFNHDNAKFKLDGKHKDIECMKCHPLVKGDVKPYILYKTGKTRCADCH